MDLSTSSHAELQDQSDLRALCGQQGSSIAMRSIIESWHLKDNRQALPPPKATGTVFCTARSYSKVVLFSTSTVCGCRAEAQRKGSKSPFQSKQ
eukprot:1147440-Pelagomonas_calceolata.AAC.3